MKTDRDEKRSRNASSTGSVTSTSQSLLSRLRKDDAQAWDRLVRLYSPLVYYWCRQQRLSDQEIPDVVQEVFRSVATNIERFRKDRPRDTFRGWLRTITRSKVVDFYRRQNRQPQAAGGSVAHLQFSQVPDVEPQDDEDEAAEQQVHHRLFLQALELIQEDFQERTWQAFWRVVVDGQSPKDVAEELSMQPGGVRVAKSRVLQRLRQELGDLLD